MSSAAENTGKHSIDRLTTTRLSPESARLLIQTIEEIEREEAEEQDRGKRRHDSASEQSEQVEELPETD